MGVIFFLFFCFLLGVLLDGISQFHTSHHGNVGHKGRKLELLGSEQKQCIDKLDNTTTDRVVAC